jgi:hypothetical protein
MAATNLQLTKPMTPEEEILVLVHLSHPWLEEERIPARRRSSLETKLRTIQQAATYFNPDNTYVVGKSLSRRTTPEIHATILNLAEKNKYLTGGTHAPGLMTAATKPIEQAPRQQKAIRIGGFYADLCCATYALLIEEFTKHSSRKLVPIIDYSISHWSPST